MSVVGQAMDYREMPEADVHQLWRDFSRSPDQENRDRIVSVYTSFARMLAAKLYAKRQVREIEFDEYLHYALLGLLESIDRYDPTQGAAFQTFASARIAGAVLNGIEKHSEYQQQVALRTRIRKERVQSLQSDAGRENSTSLFEELADIAIGLAVGYMLDGSGMYQEGCHVQARTGYDKAEFGQLCEILRRLVDALPEQQKKVVKYHYFFAHGFDEIGLLLGVTKGRVSQVHKKALLQLRVLYQRFGDLDRSL